MTEELIVIHLLKTVIVHYITWRFITESAMASYLQEDEYAMKKSSIFRRHRRFKEGRDLQDDPEVGN
jgi:hypothetical protein